MNKEAELYIHFPFCVKKCAYCDFLSFAGTTEQKENYINALLHEIAASAYIFKGRTIRSVYFGGGTPTFLHAEQILSVFQMLTRVFSIKKDAEISIECNPGTAGLEKLSALKSEGFNRLSIGVQSFQNDLLRMIGRIHSGEEAVSCFENARKAGFENINLDLIFALPSQTLTDWEESLKAAAALSCEHISAYSLILEEGTPLYETKDQYRFPDEEEERAMYYETAEILSAYGYHQYEISNYAKPGYECMHNTGYWREIPYMGLGLGASSYINDTRYRNTDVFDEYVKNCENPKEQYKEITVLSISDQMSEFIFLGLRMTDGISLAEFKERFGKDLLEVYPDVVKKYEKTGFLEIKEGRMRFTKEGVSVSNRILCEFV